MTRKELSQLYYLRGEISNDERKLAALEDAATRITANLGGMPGGGMPNDKTAIAAEIADLKEIIQSKKRMCVAYYNQIMRYVAGIDDSLVRQIITYRNLDMLTWREVAQRIGGGNSEDGLRKVYTRYLDRR